MDEDEMPEGEYVDLPDVDDDAVEDTEDGGAIVRMDDDAPPKAENEFYANLAEDMPEHEMSSLSTQLLDLISKDKDARKKRDEQYEDCLRRTGLCDVFFFQAEDGIRDSPE